MSAKQYNATILQRADTLANFLAKDKVYLENELLIVKVDDKNTDIYIGDGVKPFSQLEPIFSSTWVFGRNTISLTPVKLLATDWVNNIQTKPVTGVLANESEQLILPAWAGQSKEIAQSCGVNFIVRQDGALDFTCNVTPTEDLIIYIGILGKQTENEDDNQAYIKTDIDSNFSSSSTNPVENRVITNKINSIEATIRGITGEDSSTGTINLTALSNIVNNLNESMTSIKNYYKNDILYNKEHIIGITDNSYGEEEAVYRFVIPFEVTVDKNSLYSNMDITAVVINNNEEIITKLDFEFNDLLEGKWTGSIWENNIDTKNYFGGFPIMLVEEGSKILLTGMPLKEQPYVLKGNVILTMQGPWNEDDIIGPEGEDTGGEVLPETDGNGPLPEAPEAEEATLTKI